MKKLLILAFCISVLALYGCAVVDSWPYYDLDQTSSNYNGEPPWPPTPWELVDTNGKAHMQEPILIMNLFPDHSEEIIWFFDQNPNNSTITLSNYVNMEPASPAYTWHDDFYCNPDWNGCAWVTATRPLDYIDQYWPISPNWNCTDITFGFLFAAWSYPGCGRNLPLADKISLLNMGELGTLHHDEGLWYEANSKNLTITLENQYGQTFNVPILTDLSVFWSPDTGKFALDLTNPILANGLKWYADWLETYSTNGTSVTVTYNGISEVMTIAGWGEDHTGFSPDFYRNAANKLY